MRGSIIKQVTKRDENGKPIGYSPNWTIILNLGKDPTTGKRKQRWITFKGTKHEADKKLRDLLVQNDQGRLPKPGKTTVSEFLNKWLSEYAKFNLSPRGFERYQDIVNKYHIPAYGKLPLTYLMPEHLQKADAAALESGLSAQTVRYHHAVIHKALQTALEWGLVSRNVADAVRPPKANRKEMSTWDEYEVSQFLEAAKDSPYYEWFVTAFYTGMRKSEICGLQWQDIDLFGLQLSVKRGAHYLKDGSVSIKDVKSAKSKRNIAIPPSLGLVLKELWEREQRKGQDLVFRRKDGRPLHPNTLTHAWQAIIKKAGLKPIRIHDIRHTHASLMLKQGVHPKIVQERLGHSSIEITLDIYSHVVPGLQEAAAKMFDDAVLRYSVL